MSAPPVAFDLWHVAVPLLHPFEAAHGTETHREVVVLRAVDADGGEGWGECDALTHPTYTINFAAPGVAPGPGEVAWDDAYLTANRTQLDNLVHSVGTPEAWLISKNAKVPKSRQWNFGVRRVQGQFAFSAAYTGVRGVDQFTLNWANFGLNPDGTCCTSFNLGAHGFSNFIYSSNDAKTWYDALNLTAERPYRPKKDGIGWGAGITTTIAWRSLQGVDALGDLFAFPNTAGINKHPSNDERARIVANWIMDVPYLFGIQYSGLITLGSGNKQDTGCPARFCATDYRKGAFSPPGYNFLIFGKWAYRSVDMRLRKDFPRFAGSHLGVTVDAFNVFNFQNEGCFNLGGLPTSKLTSAMDLYAREVVPRVKRHTGGG